MNHAETQSGAPYQGAHRATAVAYDADEHACNLTDWQQRYDQISAGQFRGSITELASDGLQVFHEFTSQSLHQNCNVWPDSIWLGIAATPGADSRINGIAVGDNELMCRPGDCEFELMTPENHHIYGIVARREELIRTAQIQGVEIDWRDFSAHERLSLPEKTMTDLRFLLHRLLREPTVLPGARLQQDLVMMALLEILQQESPKRETAPSYQRRKRVVERAVAHMEAHRDQPVTITELCNRVGASRRTLQYSFDSIVGVSPVQYLRVTRLNGVRRGLLKADRGTTVADIAAEWGFLHLSQFAKDYRELFGEKPSDTLEKHPPLQAEQERRSHVRPHPASPFTPG